jgi:hypothetical protein
MPKTELKRVQRHELKQQLQVVLNTRPDATVYTIEVFSTNGLYANLSYLLNGQRYNGGRVHVAELYYPSE